MMLVTINSENFSGPSSPHLQYASNTQKTIDFEGIL
jgi:hypothetical protein